MVLGEVIISYDVSAIISYIAGFNRHTIFLCLFTFYVNGTRM